MTSKTDLCNVHPVKPARSAYRSNSLTMGWEVIVIFVLGLFALACIIPFILVIVVSFTDELTLAQNGYSFFPTKTSLAAYQFIFGSSDQLIQSYVVSIFISVVGTAIHLLITALYAYALYRKDFKFRTFFTFFAFFTMLFGGGLVPGYLVMTRVLLLKDTIWALIVPLLVSPYSFIILRTFFTSAIPDSLLESAFIDGSGEFRTLFVIALPLALPGLATIALFSVLGYWNEWFNALLYVTNPMLFPIQYMLMKIENNMNFLIENARSLSSTQASEMLRNLPRVTARMAIVVCVVLPIAIAYPFFQRFFIAGLTVGAIKG